MFGRRPPNLGCRVHCRRRVGRLRDLAGRGGAGISVSASALEHLDMNGFTPEEMSRGGDAAAAVAAVVAAAAAAASAGNGNAAGAGAEVPGAGAVSAAGPPGAAGPGPGQLCCLREDGERCGRAAGNASFSKRIQKSISQKKVKIELDKSVSDLGPPRGVPAAVQRRGLLAGFTAPADWLQCGLVRSPLGSKQQSRCNSDRQPHACSGSCPASPPPRLPLPASPAHSLPSSSFCCDLETKQRGPPHRGPRVVFL